MSLAITLVIAGMAISPITRTLKTYQLNNAANQLAGIIKFTRFEAIRRNMAIKCVNSQAGAYAEANIWADNDGDGVEGATEKQILLNPNATLVSAGVVPNTSALAAAANIPTLTPISPGSDAIKFDQRGAVVVGLELRDDPVRRGRPGIDPERDRLVRWHQHVAMPHDRRRRSASGVSHSPHG